MRRAPFGMSTGCCMETNLTINFIYLKKKHNAEKAKEIRKEKKESRKKGKEGNEREGEGRNHRRNEGRQ